MKKQNFNLPEPVADEFYRLFDTTRLRDKEKWKLCAAAVLALAEMNEEELRAAVRRVHLATLDADGFELLVAQAASRRGDEIEVEIVPSRPSTSGRAPGAPAPDRAGSAGPSHPPRLPGGRLSERAEKR